MASEAKGSGPNEAKEPGTKTPTLQTSTPAPDKVRPKKIDFADTNSQSTSGTFGAGSTSRMPSFKVGELTMSRASMLTSSLAQFQELPTSLVIDQQSPAVIGIDQELERVASERREITSEKEMLRRPVREHELELEELKLKYELERKRIVANKDEKERVYLDQVVALNKRDSALKSTELTLRTAKKKLLMPRSQVPGRAIRPGPGGRPSAARKRQSRGRDFNRPRKNSRPSQKRYDGRRIGGRQNFNGNRYGRPSVGREFGNHRGGFTRSPAGGFGGRGYEPYRPVNDYRPGNEFWSGNDYRPRSRR